MEVVPSWRISSGGPEIGEVAQHIRNGLFVP